MAIRDYAEPFKVIDQTEAIISIPNQWGLINELGLFQQEGVTQHTVSVESQNGTLALIGDTKRGTRNQVNKDDIRAIRTFAIPNFSVDDAVFPEDVQGQRAYGSDNPDTTDAVIARKLARLRQNHAATLEYARAQAICTGGVYAPNGTVAAQNAYTEFGVTRKEVDFVFGTATTDMIAKSEESLSYIQDNIQTGDVVNRMVALCSPGFFGKLIAHPTIKDAYKFYTSTQEPLRNRLGSGLYRRFEFGGVEYIEYRGSYAGQALITAGEAFMLPVGVMDMFKTFNSPASKFGSVNAVGEPLYAFTYYDMRDEKIVLQTEQNMMNLVTRPQGVTRLFSSN